jgi:repressor of nif and glnA expression
VGIWVGDTATRLRSSLGEKILQRSLKRLYHHRWYDPRGLVRKNGAVSFELADDKFVKEKGEKRIMNWP